MEQFVFLSYLLYRDTKNTFTIVVFLLLLNGKRFVSAICLSNVGVILD